MGIRFLSYDIISFRAGYVKGNRTRPTFLGAQGISSLEILRLEEGPDGQISASCRRLNIYACSFSYALNNPHLHCRMEGFDDIRL